MLVGGTDFHVYGCDRVGSDKPRGGGVALFVRNSVDSVVVDNKNFPSGCEVLCVDFIVNINLRFIVIYRPPLCPVPETKPFSGCIADWTLTDGGG